MNLADQPWIPVVDTTGAKQLTSLLELFRNGDAIRDLAVNPVQRIALMRLLICIAQAALDGPEDEQDWFNCRPRMADSAIAYLKKWHDRFELYGERPFMQIPDLHCKDGTDKSSAVLDCCSPYGGSGNPLFDHASLDPNLAISDAANALNLLTLLNFSTSGRVGQSMWQGIQYSDATFAAPCIKACHIFIRGRNLLDTIHCNLLTKHGRCNGVGSLPNGRWGVPVWERLPTHATDKPAFANATETYLGRLVPLSRMVSLSAIPGRCIMGPLPGGCRIEHLPAFREPSTAIAADKDGSTYYLNISSTKHMWRDLGAVLILRETEKRQGAIVLNIIRQFPDRFSDSMIDIWVGGLELGLQAAKLNDMVEWVFTLPLSLLETSSLRQYESGVNMATIGEAALRDAVKTYYGYMHMDSRQIPCGTAQTFYWSDLDRQYEVLVQVASDSETNVNDAWLPIVRQAMEAAYSHACPHLTPRQIQAFAKGLGVLQQKSSNHASTN